MHDEHPRLPSWSRDRSVKAIDTSALVQRDVFDYDMSADIAR